MLVSPTVVWALSTSIFCFVFAAVAPAAGAAARVGLLAPSSVALDDEGRWSMRERLAGTTSRLAAVGAAAAFTAGLVLVAVSAATLLEAAAPPW